MYLQTRVSAVGLFGVVPVLSSGAGRLWRRHEGPLHPFSERHHGPGPKVSVCPPSVFFRLILFMLICTSSHICVRSLHLWMALVSVMFIFGSDILVKASVVFVVCVSRGMTNMSIRKFSARTIQFIIASLLILNFHTGFLLQSFTGSSILLFYFGLNFHG